MKANKNYIILDNAITLMIINITEKLVYSQIVPAD